MQHSSTGVQRLNKEEPERHLGEADDTSIEARQAGQWNVEGALSLASEHGSWHLAPFEPWLHHLMATLLMLINLPVPQFPLLQNGYKNEMDRAPGQHSH